MHFYPFHPDFSIVTAADDNMKQAGNLMMLVTAAEMHCKAINLSTVAKCLQCEDTAAEKAAKFSCVYGSKVYKVKLYHDNLMKTVQKLADITKITLCMEISGEQTSENVQFSSILYKCGSELSDIGNFLEDKAK